MVHSLSWGLADAIILLPKSVELNANLLEQSTITEWGGCRGAGHSTETPLKDLNLCFKTVWQCCRLSSYPVSEIAACPHRDNAGETDTPNALHSPGYISLPVYQVKQEADTAGVSSYGVGQSDAPLKRERKRLHYFDLLLDNPSGINSGEL